MPATFLPYIQPAGYSPPRLARCDSQGVPKVVQFITFRPEAQGFVVTLFNGQRRFLSGSLVGVGHRAPTERDYRRVERVFSLLGTHRCNKEAANG